MLTPLSRTKKSQQDMVLTMLILPTFLGNMVGGELEKKTTLIFGFSDTQMTRDSLAATPCRHAFRGAKTTPLSLTGLGFGTPYDTFDIV